MEYTIEEVCTMFQAPKSLSSPCGACGRMHAHAGVQSHTHARSIAYSTPHMHTENLSKLK
jgi:hypothetical protein